MFISMIVMKTGWDGVISEQKKDQLKKQKDRDGD